jgi:hypothetical protein
MFAGFGGGALAQAYPLQHGVHVPELHVSASAYGLPTPLQMTAAGAHRVELLHAGQPRSWLVVACCHAILLEAPQLRYFAARMQRVRPWCAQWLGHAGLWLIVAALRKWGVPHTMLVQHAGDVLLLAPGCYYQASDTGACVSKAMCWADASGSVRAADHEPCSVLCQQLSHAALLPRPLEWQAAAAEQTPAASAHCIDSRYQPAPGPLWRPGDGIGGVVQLVEGARQLLRAGPNNTDEEVGSLSFSLSLSLSLSLFLPLSLSHSLSRFPCRFLEPYNYSFNSSIYGPNAHAGQMAASTEAVRMLALRFGEVRLTSDSAEVRRLFIHALACSLVDPRALRCSSAAAFSRRPCA